MSSSEDRFCTKCGSQIATGAAFCPSCGNPVGAATQHQSRHDGRMRWREYRYARRGGDKSGPIVGGLIVVWLGITLLLSNGHYIAGSAFFGYFLSGMGVMLIIAGALRWGVFHYRYPPIGYLIGGAFLLIIGLAGIIQTAFYGPAILIAIGVVIIVFGAYSMRSKAPSQSTSSPSQV